MGLQRALELALRAGDVAGHDTPGEALLEPERSRLAGMGASGLWLWYTRTARRRRTQAAR